MTRSLLFVPALEQALHEKALKGKADGIIIDLEDAVPLAKKDEARKLVSTLLPDLIKSAKKILIRINNHGACLDKDLEAVVREGLDTIILPKCESIDELVSLDTVIAKLEKNNDLKNNSISLYPMLESAKGILQFQKADSLPQRVRALVFGPEDFSKDTGMACEAEVLQVPFQQLAMIATAFDRLLIGYPGSISNYHDMETFRAATELGKRCGASAGLAIHPRQVEILNDVMRPSELELSEARQIVKCFEEALQNGKAVASWSGRMIDEPVYQRARRLLETQSD